LTLRRAVALAHIRKTDCLGAVVSVGLILVVALAIVVVVVVIVVVPIPLMVVIVIAVELIGKSGEVMVPAARIGDRRAAVVGDCHADAQAA
jgi:hypothetical protein